MNERDDPAAGGELSDRAKELFDSSVAGLDAETRSRLNRGRQAALAETGRARPARLPWAFGAGVAAAAVLAVALWSGNSPAPPPSPDASAADFEILLDEDSLEMLEELEFYSWIEFAEDTAPQSDDQVG